MDCKTLAEIFAGDRGDDLDEADSAAFEEHLNGCATCLDMLAKAEEELAPLTGWEAPAPTAAQWDVVTAGVTKELDNPRGRVLTARPRPPLYLVAAAAILFTAGLVILLLSDGPRGGSGDTAAGFIPHDPPPPVVVGPAPSEQRDVEVLAYEGFNGYAVESVDYDGVACVVITKDS